MQIITDRAGETRVKLTKTECQTIRKARSLVAMIDRNVDRYKLGDTVAGLDHVIEKYAPEREAAPVGAKK